MVGADFRRIFAVADDDQTIYEWNGANVRRIGTLIKDFNCKVMQLPTNCRCPPRIVEAAIVSSSTTLSAWSRSAPRSQQTAIATPTASRFGAACSRPTGTKRLGLRPRSLVWTSRSAAERAGAGQNPRIAGDDVRRFAGRKCEGDDSESP